MAYYNIYKNENGTINGLITQPINGYIHAHLFIIETICLQYNGDVNVLILEHRLNYTDYIDGLLYKLQSIQQIEIRKIERVGGAISIELYYVNHTIKLIVPIINNIAKFDNQPVTDLSYSMKWWDQSDICICDVKMGAMTTRLIHRFINIDIIYTITQINGNFSNLWKITL